MHTCFSVCLSDNNPWDWQHIWRTPLPVDELCHALLPPGTVILPTKTINPGRISLCRLQSASATYRQISGTIGGWGEMRWDQFVKYHRNSQMFGGEFWIIGLGFHFIWLKAHDPVTCFDVICPIPSPVHHHGDWCFSFSRKSWFAQTLTGRANYIEPSMLNASVADEIVSLYLCICVFYFTCQKASHISHIIPFGFSFWLRNKSIFTRHCFAGQKGRSQNRLCCSNCTLLPQPNQAFQTHKIHSTGAWAVFRLDQYSGLCRL